MCVCVCVGVGGCEQDSRTNQTWQPLLTEYQHWSTFWQSTQNESGREGKGKW